MKWYTVLLLVPPFATDYYGSDVDQSWQRAPSAQAAAKGAQRDAVSRSDFVDDPDDFFVLAVYVGRKRRLFPKEETT